MRKLGKLLIGLVLIVSLAACGGTGDSESQDAQNTGGDGAANVNIEVTGELNFTLGDASRASYMATEMGDEMTVWQFNFYENDQQVVVMFYNNQPTTGEYEITPSGPLEEGVGVLVSDNSGEEPILFTSSAEGTITIEQDGDLYSGTFAFSIPDLTDPGTTVIEAEGTFSGVELSG